MAQGETTPNVLPGVTSDGNGGIVVAGNVKCDSANPTAFVPTGTPPTISGVKSGTLGQLQTLVGLLLDALEAENLIIDTTT